jgi:hypothetical protein
MITLRSICPTIICTVLLSAGSMGTARADLDGHGPDAWRVSGVRADDVLNARMGPGTNYAVISHFKPDEGGLQQITCVPFLPAGAYMAMSEGERKALPSGWCLMRSGDLSRAGWVAARFLQEDGTQSAEKSQIAPGITGADGTRLKIANTDGEPMMVIDAPDMGLTYSLPPGWATDEPYFYETAAGARATRPTMTFYVNDREEWRALLWLNPRQMQSAGCVETEAGDLCYREQNDRQAAEYIAPMIHFDAGAVSAQ